MFKIIDFPHRGDVDMAYFLKEIKYKCFTKQLEKKRKK
jgi:hypothetical protein